MQRQSVLASTNIGRVYPQARLSDFHEPGVASFLASPIRPLTTWLHTYQDMLYLVRGARS